MLSTCPTKRLRACATAAGSFCRSRGSQPNRISSGIAGSPRVPSISSSSRPKSSERQSCPSADAGRGGGPSCFGKGEIARPGNARVAGGPFLTSAMAICPAASPASTQFRAAAWKARRQAVRQNTCRFPPSRRAWNGRSHHEQCGASLIATSGSRRASEHLHPREPLSLRPRQVGVEFHDGGALFVGVTQIARQRLCALVERKVVPVQKCNGNSIAQGFCGCSRCSRFSHHKIETRRATLLIGRGIVFFVSMRSSGRGFLLLGGKKGNSGNCL